MSEKQRIPKIIHYCWFGGAPLPELVLKCIESWKKYCPDYEIRRWDETNFDLNCCRYVREAYEAKKWAFVSDVARLYALTRYGGIYMDTDVELIGPLDDRMLCYGAFCGLESETKVGTALIGAQKDHPFFADLLNGYMDEAFVRSDGSYNTSTNVKRITAAFEKYGFIPENRIQHLEGITVYPTDFFCPKDFETGETVLTENTCAIHYYDGSWWTEEQKYAGRLAVRLRKFLPAKLAKRIARGAGVLKYRGGRAFLQKLIKTGR